MSAEGLLYNPALFDETFGEVLSARERGGLAPPLIPPLLSPHAEADVGMCAKADELQKYLVSAKGFAYGVEGKDAKMKPGVIGTAAGDEARFCVDTSRLALSQPFVVIIGHLISYEHMGVARVSCLAGCTCESTIIDAHRIDRRRNVSIYVEKVLPAIRMRDIDISAEGAAEQREDEADFPDEAVAPLAAARAAACRFSLASCSFV